MYGEKSFSNQNNFRGRNFVPNTNRDNPRATANFTQQNKNFNYNLGHSFAGQNYRNNHFPFSDNTVRFDGHNHAPTSHPGTNQAHDNNRRDMKEKSYNPRPSGNGFVQNGVFHHCEFVNTPNTGAIEPGRSQGGNAQEGI